MRLLMITGDRALVQGKKGPFYYMLEEFSKYWERIDILCPRISTKRSDQTLQTYQPFNNVFIHSSNLPLIFQPWFILRKGQEIFKEQKFDLFTIHGYPPFYNDLGGLWLHNKIKVPYALEIMHITGYPKAGNLKDWFYKILSYSLIKFFARKAMAVRIINQKQTGEFLIQSGVNKEKLKYIPAFYIDFNVFKPQEMDKPHTNTELVRGKYDIVFSGRLVKNKGIGLLLGAIKNIQQAQRSNISGKHSDHTFQAIKLIIIGDGPLKSNIKKFITKNNLQSSIELAGWLPTINDLAKIYNQSKMMVMSSFNEGGPRVTLEAMACKVPVITSRVGIMLDIINDGKNGVFIDWDVKDIVNKIMLLLKDDDLRLKIAENGYQAVQQFERKKVIENYAKTYQNLLHTS
jgi:glycosyltransferase involved in cell wall biosynthesis